MRTRFTSYVGYMRLIFTFIGVFTVVSLIKNYKNMYVFQTTFDQILSYCLVVTALSIVLFVLPYIIAPSKYWSEKFSAYECGFEPFETPSEVFESHFIVVAVLFIIFDLEIIFLFPWAATAGITQDIGFYAFIIYSLILALALFYEWRKGALKWPIFFMFKKKDFFA